MSRKVKKTGISGKASAGKKPRTAAKPKIARRSAGTKDTVSSHLRHSPYLSGLYARWPDVAAAPPDAAEAEVYTALSRSLAADYSHEAVRKTLRVAKQKIALLCGLADVRGEWDAVRVMRCLSDFADAAVRAAADALLTQAHDAKHIKLPHPKTPQKDCGVSVVALGKWGAHELNYSSDIDLMVLFDAARTPIKDPDAAQAFFIRFTRDMAQMLEQPTADGYVFRCDLRLRPDPGAMPLAVSIATAEMYYGSLGQNWERAAMIKARPVAGDARIADDFKRLMTSWIWRRNLDFAAIQDIHSIKRQINAKQSKQAPRKNGDNPYLGVNVKLGHGGIREIEFYAQTQQLIFGGRDTALRTPSTLAALDILCSGEHITPDDRDALSAAYLFLRHTEHRLQMVDDRQTHSLPTHPQDFTAIAEFCGYANSAALMADLKKHMTAVQTRYSALFRESQSLSQEGNLVFTGVEDDPETLHTLRGMGFDAPEKITAAIRGWHHGRYRAVRSERARQILTEITPHLLKTLGATPHPDDAFIRFDRFLEKLPSGIPIFSMFAHHPQLLELTAEIMGTAPALAEWLGTHPQVLDGVISRDFFGRLPTLDWLTDELQRRLDAARDYQDTLDITRRWAREKRFHAGIHILRRLSDTLQTAAYLSDIAEASLRLLTPAVEREFARAHGTVKGGKYIVLAMGSFAARTMFTDSDLDLIALYDTPDSSTASSGDKQLPPSQYYIRLTQRLISAITAPTSESVLYSVDARLRPAGNDGPLAVSVNGFLDYQTKNAWTWEHMSLLRHRVIYGDTKAAHKLTAGITRILSAPRDAQKLQTDITDMQARVRKQFGADNHPWDLKYRKGGMMDQLFALQYLQLRHAADAPDVLSPQTPDALAALRRAKKISAADAQDLAQIFSATLSAQAFLRLSAALPFDPARATRGMQVRLADILAAGTAQKKKPAAADFKKSSSAFLKKLAEGDKICARLLAPAKPARAAVKNKKAAAPKRKKPAHKSGK